MTSEERWYPYAPLQSKRAIQLGWTLVWLWWTHFLFAVNAWAGGSGGGEQRTIPDAIREGGNIWDNTRQWATENPVLFVAMLIAAVLIFGKGISLGRRRG
jgi:hypothetical protein